MDDLKLNQNFRWIITRKDFFTQEECDVMKKYIDDNSERSRGHAISKTDDVNFKWDSSDCILNVSKNDEQKYLDKFWNAITVANQVHYKFNISGIYHNRIQAHRYDKDDSYNPHADFHNYKDYSTPKLTCIVFLNDGSEYEGGELKMFDGTIIEPEVGKLIIHPAFAGHEVTPVTKGERYSCVVWAVGDTFV